MSKKHLNKKLKEEEEKKEKEEELKNNPPHFVLEIQDGNMGNKSNFSNGGN